MLDLIVEYSTPILCLSTAAFLILACINAYRAGYKDGKLAGLAALDRSRPERRLGMKLSETVTKNPPSAAVGFAPFKPTNRN